MEYSVELAKEYIGKRFIIGLRHINPQGEETHSGLWGVVVHVDEGGLLLQVEGGIEDEFWMIPPDFDGIIPATQKCYQLEGCDTVVESVDYESYWAIADSPDKFE